MTEHGEDEDYETEQLTTKDSFTVLTEPRTNSHFYTTAIRWSGRNVIR